MNILKLSAQILIILIAGLLIIGCETPEISPVASPASSSSTPSNSLSPSKTPVLPTEYLKDPLNGLIVVSDCIVSGNITAQKEETIQSGGGKNYFTYSTLSIDKVIKGDPNLKEISIKTEYYVGALVLQISDQLIICLHKENDNIYIPQSDPIPTSGPIIINNPRHGVLWIKSTDLTTRNPLDEIIGRVIQIMRANQIPVALPQNQWPPLPIGPVTLPTK